MYKMIQGLYDQDVLPRFEMRENVVSRTNRRHSKQIYISSCEKEVRANFFINRVAPVWNGLTQEVVDAPSVDTFKKRLDRLWENHPMKYDYTESVLNF